MTRRVSETTAQVLTYLLHHPKPVHGYAIHIDVGVASGSLYPILHRLEDRGMLNGYRESNPPSWRPPRIYWELTEPGRVFAKAVVKEANS